MQAEQAERARVEAEQRAEREKKKPLNVPSVKNRPPLMRKNAARRKKPIDSS
jgi:hypothetical protein